MNTAILLQIGTNLDLGTLKFAQEGGVNPLYVGVLGGLVLIVAGVTVYLLVTRRMRLAEANRQREEARLRLLLSESNLTPKDREDLEVIRGSEEAPDLIPLVSLRSAFEAAVEEFREANPRHPVLKRVPSLRQRLGYGFGNLRNAFTSTRMLPAGTRVQCTIPEAKGAPQFVTTVLGTNETGFFIRPPTTRGKPVDLSRFKTLHFKVSRESDAEYEFTSRLLGQSQQAMRAIAVSHSTDIRKLLYRAAPRVDVEIDAKFFVIKEEVAQERRHRAFKQHEAQYSLPGKILDISLGGSRIRLENPQLKPAEGDLIVFQLPQAQVKEDLVSEILDIAEIKPGVVQIHLRFVGMKELNRLKLSKFIQIQQEAEAEEAESGPEPASTAS